MRSLILLIFLLGCHNSWADNTLTLAPIPALDLPQLEAPVQQQIQEAINTLNKGLTRSDRTFEQLANLYGELGKLLHAYQLLEAAKVAYHNAGTLAPNNQEWPYLYGVVNQQLNDPAAAINAFQYVVPRLPNHLPTQLRLAQLYRQENQLEKAQALLDSALQQFPDEPSLQAEMGQLALAKGDAQQAIERLTQVVKVEPRANRLHYPLAMAYRKLGDSEKARQHLAQLGKIGITVTDAIMQEIEALKQGERLPLIKGKIAFNAGDYPAAAQAFNQVLQTNPENVDATINLGTTLFQMQRYQQAYELFQRAVKLDNDSHNAHYNLGSLLRFGGESELAIQHLRHAIQLNPDDGPAHKELANAYLQQGDLANAQAQYQRALKLNTTDRKSWLGLVSTQIRQQLYREALNSLERAYNNLPNDMPIIAALAKMLAGSPLLEIRDGERALYHAKQAYQQLPSLNNAEILAMAYGENNQCQTAANLMEKFTAALEKQQTEYLESAKAAAQYYKQNSPCRNAPYLAQSKPSPVNVKE